MNKQEALNKLISVETTLLNFEAAKLSAVETNKWLYGLANDLLDARKALAALDDNEATVQTAPSAKPKYNMSRKSIVQEIACIQDAVSDTFNELSDVIDRLDHLRDDAEDTK